MQQIQTTLQQWGTKITDALKAAIPPQKDISGVLKQSIGFTINYAGLPIIFELQIADFYKFIDKGRQPGRYPPPDVIKAWIVNRQIPLKPLPSLKTLSKKPMSIRSQLNALNNLSFLIGRKIAREGILPTNFYSNTITPEVIDELANNLSAAFKQDVVLMLVTPQ